MNERRIPMPHRPVRDPVRLRQIDRDVNDAIARHSAAGFLFDAGGVTSFARQRGDGADVLLLHGVPTSSFLYRKVLPVLSDEGLRATAFDFPGLAIARSSVAGLQVDSTLESVRHVCERLFATWRTRSTSRTRREVCA